MIGSYDCECRPEVLIQEVSDQLTSAPILPTRPVSRSPPGPISSTRPVSSSLPGPRSPPTPVSRTSPGPISAPRPVSRLAFRSIPSPGSTSSLISGPRSQSPVSVSSDNTSEEEHSSDEERGPRMDSSRRKRTRGEETTTQSTSMQSTSMQSTGMQSYNRISQNRIPWMNKAEVDMKEHNLFTDQYAYAHFIEMNFFKSEDFPERFTLSSPLARSRLRPKEVSMVKVFGHPRFRHWYINYSSREGKPDVVENKHISEAVHGMTWRTNDPEAYDFGRFYILLNGAAAQGKLYTMNKLAYYYLVEVCDFSNVTLLERRVIEFDPYINECGHHSKVPNGLNRCTANRVWATRHSFSKELSPSF